MELLEVDFKSENLKFRRFTGDWGIKYIEVSKGGYKTQLNEDLHNLRDCSGLDASIEMASVVAYNLEYGYIAPFGQPKPPKRISISAEERVTILKLIHKLRKQENVDEFFPPQLPKSEGD